MAKLTGLEIYKLLPKTNCGDCNFPTCMAFGLQVAAKKEKGAEPMSVKSMTLSRLTEI